MPPLFPEFVTLSIIAVIIALGFAVRQRREENENVQLLQLLQLLSVLLLAFDLSPTCMFPVFARAGGPETSTNPPASLVLAMFAGIIGKWLWDGLDSGVYHAVNLLKPLIVSPMVILTLANSSTVIHADLVGYCFCFQNGFFWQTVLHKSAGKKSDKKKKSSPKRKGDVDSTPTDSGDNGGAIDESSDRSADVDVMRAT